MAMDLAALRTEVFGPYGYLDDGSINATRVDRWINQAYLELCGEANWPFLEATATGTAPLAVSDLVNIIAVTDSRGGSLHQTQLGALTRLVNNTLTQAGAAAFYYVTGGNVVNTYPTPTSSITVRYIKYPGDLTSSTDEPLVPDRFRDLIALGALRRAAIDNQAWEAAAGYRKEYEDRLDIMLVSEIAPPRYQQIVYSSEDQ